MVQPRDVVPAAILSQHVAILGKTGSGKSSTGKLLMEQVAAGGARVCILDPIKSDWWGLTSSADGKHAGLPFHILGGPRGHVPLHASAGKAVAEVVANGSLPLSIIDMADFEPGGQAKFFVDFAPTLLRKMRGVVYLVIEEAHLFAPKERSGIGAENLSIHWAKTLATAGRSKGIRLVLVTQRTQALHNALLGSCDTLIAHRLTAPADQAPVLSWLKANTSKEVLEQVASSLASLKTGDAWLCSGEAKRFEVMHFPRIATYDNTATPTGDGETRAITTAAVDAEQLRALIGAAVDQAKADDPKELRRAIAEKDRRIKELERAAAASSHSNEKAKPEVIEKPVVSVEQVYALEAMITTLFTTIEKATALLTEPTKQLRGSLDELAAAVKSVRQPALPYAQTRASYAPKRANDARLTTRMPLPAPSPKAHHAAPGDLTGPELKILTALAELEALGLHPADKQQLGLMAGYTNVRSGGFSEPLGRIVAGGYVTSPQTGQVAITDSGRAAVGPVSPPADAEEMQARIMAKLSGPEQRILRVVLGYYPQPVTKDRIAADCDPPYTNIRSGGFSEPLGRLNTLGIVRTSGGQVVASPALFLEG